MRGDRFCHSHDEGYSDQHPVVRCKLRSYARFACWLDAELAKLEARWRAVAAPCARRPGPLAAYLRGGRPKPR